MKRTLTLFACLAVLLFSSCSTEEEALLPTNTSSPDILQDLSHSTWQLIGCPDHEYLTINGKSECSYLANINFEDSKVFITHDGSSYRTPHHICFVNGDRLVVSIQECSNTTWKSLFEWEIITMDNHTMIMDVTVPNLAPAYKQRFTFEKAQ